MKITHFKPLTVWRPPRTPHLVITFGSSVEMVGRNPGFLSQFASDGYVPFQASGIRKGREILKGEGYPSFRSVKGLKSRLTDAF